MDILLSKNFKLSELTRSATASRLGIDNTPSPQVLSRLKTLCETVLQPIRDKYKKPIIVSSGYRNQIVNKAVGGVSTSDHLYGCAADIAPQPPAFVEGQNAGEYSNTPYDKKKAVKELFDLIKQMIDNKEITVKQLIDEKNYSWIHISFQDGRTSKINQVLHLK